MFYFFISDIHYHILNIYCKNLLLNSGMIGINYRPFDFQLLFYRSLCVKIHNMDNNIYNLE